MGEEEKNMKNETRIIVMLLFVFGALSALPTAEANEVMNNEHLDADTSIPEMNLGTMIFENPLWYMAGGVLMVSKDNKRQRKPRRAKIKVAPGRNKEAGKNQQSTQFWAAKELGIETPGAFMDRVVQNCAHEEQGDFLEVLEKEFEEQYNKIANRLPDPRDRVDYLCHAILEYPASLKKNQQHLNHSMLHISFDHDKLFTLLKNLRDKRKINLGSYTLQLTKESYIPSIIQRGYKAAATKIAELQVENNKDSNYEEYKSKFNNEGWVKFKKEFELWAERLKQNGFSERGLKKQPRDFGVEIVDVMQYMTGEKSAQRKVPKRLSKTYRKIADRGSIPLDKKQWVENEVQAAKAAILTHKLKRFKIALTKNAQDYLVWHCTSMPDKMVVSNKDGEIKLKSRSDWNGLRCYFGPTNGMLNNAWWNVKQEGGAPFYCGDVVSYCKMRGVNSPIFTNDEEGGFSKEGIHLYTWMNVMLNQPTALKAKIAGLYINTARLKANGKDITKLESRPLYLKDVNQLEKAPRKKSNKNNKKNRTDVKLAEQLEELKDKVHSGDKYDIRRYKTEKLDSNTIADAIGGLDNIDIVDNGPLWPDTTTVKELRERCKELDLTGYSSMKKAELLALVRSHDEPKLPKSRNRKKGSKKSKTPKFD